MAATTFMENSERLSKSPERMEGRHRCVARPTTNRRCVALCFLRNKLILTTISLQLFWCRTSAPADAEDAGACFRVRSDPGLDDCGHLRKEAASPGCITTTGTLTVQTLCLRRNRMVRMMTDSSQVSRCPHLHRDAQERLCLDPSSRYANFPPLFLWQSASNLFCRFFWKSIKMTTGLVRVAFRCLVR